MATMEMTGHWELNRSENFDNFLKACGLNFLWRKAASTAKPSVQITEDGDSFEIVTKTSYRTQSMKFSIGVEFDSYVPWDDNKTHRMIAEWDAGRLIIQVSDCDDGVESAVFIREILDDELVLTQRLGNVETKRYFKRPATS